MALKPRARNARLLMVCLVIVCLVVITVDFRQGDKGPLEGIGRMTLSVITPFQEAMSKITRPIGNFFSALVSLPSLKKENDELKERNAYLESQLVAAADLQAKVAELEKDLELADQIGSGEPTGAFVISNGVSNFEWSITIDKGSDDDVQIGDAVVVSAGLVGRVVRVTGGSADVQLITDPDAGVAGRIGDTKETGVVLGQGERDMKMEGIDAAVPTSQLNGKIVKSVGYQIGDQSNVYPPGIPIGSVSRVLDSAGALSKYVTIAPVVDFSALDVVLVVRSGTPG